MPDESAFEPLEILQWEERGSLLNLVVRGSQEEIMQKLNSMNPLFAEALPLTLEEVFISEMEVAGYDINNILS
jgi:ABC-2 type transport system ATP-binding protein